MSCASTAPIGQRELRLVSDVGTKGQEGLWMDERKAVTVLDDFPPQFRAKTDTSAILGQSCVTFQAKSTTALRQFNKPVISVTHPFN